MNPRVAAAAGVALALGVAAVWTLRRPGPAAEAQPALEVTQSVRVLRRDSLGFTKKQGVTRDPARVRAILEALGVDGLPPAECPPDYSASEVSFVLTGVEVYAKRTVYLFSFFEDGGAKTAPMVVVTKSSGCRRGPAADPDALRRELRALGIVE